MTKGNLAVKGFALRRAGASFGLGVMAVVFVLASLSVSSLLFPAQAGGPILVGGGEERETGPAGVPIVWDSSTISYTVDGGGLGKLSQAQARARLARTLGQWNDIPTSSLTLVDAGPIDAALVPDGDVDTLKEFLAVRCEAKNPVIFDEDGSIFREMGVTGKTAYSIDGTCGVTKDGKKTGGWVLFNGGQYDGNPDNGELPLDALDDHFLHEMGHFIGLNHSQVNVNCFTVQDCAPGSDDSFGYPTMATGRVEALGYTIEETGGVLAKTTLSADDIAWISFLYPETVNQAPEQVPFDSVYGVLEGRVFSADGETGVQRVNVIARQVDDPSTPVNESRRIAVACHSGHLYNGSSGTTENDAYGSRDPSLLGFYQIPVPKGVYRLEVESFAAKPGARIFPRSIRNPQEILGEFYGGPESAQDDPTIAEEVAVRAGKTLKGKNIILNDRPNHGLSPAFALLVVIASIGAMGGWVFHRKMGFSTGFLGV